MAILIPSLNQQTLSRMTSGEKRLARTLEKVLEDDYLVWYDIPVGKKRRYPDFIILHPMRGILCLEVKDWKPETLKSINKTEATLHTERGRVIEPHPMEQARHYAYQVVALLTRDPQLRHLSGPHEGKLAMPYGWGVVFENITRLQIEKAMPEEGREILLPDHLMIYKGEFGETVDAETFQSRLWGMFTYQFGKPLSLPQIDRVRWHLFPEVRIDAPEQAALFEDPLEAAGELEETLPDVIRIMDIQQEQLARSLGEGHRVIHGVAGSGKTMILGYRCLYLAQTLHKPILVLCFNITLAARLRAFISAKGIGAQVQVYHFHDWCNQQLKTYQIDPVKGDAPLFERQVETVIDAVDRGLIPRGQYGALLIDEGHDMEADWLKLVVQMVDPESNSLLLLYDDAQSIYKSKAGLGFALSSVGIQAQGRTTVLRLNYRNTREILAFAYGFARHYLDPQAADEDHIPLVEPEAAGIHGPKPHAKLLDSFTAEIDYAVACIRKWQAHGTPLSDIAVLYAKKAQGAELSRRLKREGISHQWLGSKVHKMAYDSEADSVAVMTIHSSKGLEFERVIMLGLGAMSVAAAERQNSARLLYVGMTRARRYLVMAASEKSEFTERMVEAETAVAAS
ncbi:ATP-binding domain-containing protein [Nitrogeniibacter mangrovi]|uniref:DNA 3'-5' helicase n=1 Tax=Nitrogeniibacter mangrovi TaxID=2016596 RepID=A0A6C1B5K3_9RHOO|nr:nuclease-related domain-containing DEAD/DEAH box helicase [Nitrogeniibacter mangrovi]QID17580.1 ATP-binding domain-containing protein [Nitrogeniibacter mangrovi]